MLPMLFLAELRRELHAWWSYRLNTLSGLALWAIAFPLMIQTFDSVSGGYGPDRRLASLIGFLVWELCAGMLVMIAESVTGEARHGTLESIVLSPVSPSIVFLLRMGAVVVRQAIETIVLGLALVAILRLPVALTGAAVFVIGLTVIGVTGVGLALGGLAMIYKNVSSVVGVVTLLAVLFTGALVPLNDLGPIFLMLKILLPTTWGIDVLRQAIIYGETWASLWASGTLLGLGLQAAAFMAMGIIFFNWGFRRAQGQGSLGTY